MVIQVSSVMSHPVFEHYRGSLGKLSNVQKLILYFILVCILNSIIYNIWLIDSFSDCSVSQFHF